MEIEEALEKVWNKVRKKYFYPALKKPEPSTDVATAQLDFLEGRKIKINPDFCRVPKDMELEDVVEALLDHEVGHHSYCPRDFSRYLGMFSEVGKVIDDEKKAYSAFQHYMDAIVNTHNVREKETKIPELMKSLLKNTEGIRKGKMNELMASAYQEIWEKDLGLRRLGELEKELGDYKGFLDTKEQALKSLPYADPSYDVTLTEVGLLRKQVDEKDRWATAVRELSEIPYLESDRWERNAKRFAKIVEDYVDEEPLTGSEGMQGFSKDDIEKGMRDFAQKASPKQFEDTLRKLQKIMGEEGEGEIVEGGEEGGSEKGEGLGTLRIEKEEFYKLRAQKYSLPIEGLPMRKSGSLLPLTHSEWEEGDQVSDIDLWNSYGKVLPGITQKWNRVEGETHYEKSTVPDCVIIIDSSGSMTDPGKATSYAVVGAGAATDVYLKNGSKVAVYNFSDSRAGGERILDFSGDRDEIYEYLCSYHGGGTTLRKDAIDSIRDKSAGADVFLITDMQVVNLDEMIEYFSDFDGRVTAVCVGKNPDAKKFRERLIEKGNVSVYGVDEEKDIADIIIGRVRKNLGYGKR